jgi:hypothetical protein
VNSAYQGDVIIAAIAVSEFRIKLMEVLEKIENLSLTDWKRVNQLYLKSADIKMILNLVERLAH